MKKILLVVLIVVLAMGLVGGTCVPESIVHEEPEIVTFEEISQFYLEQYGSPDEVEEVDNFIRWTWNLDNIMHTVSFFHSSLSNSWKVSSEYYWYTFEQVSQPYLDKYGQPEDVYTYDSDNYHIVDWWWWSKGFEVTFCDTPYNDAYGWTVDSEYTFPPI